MCKILPADWVKEKRSKRYEERERERERVRLRWMNDDGEDCYKREICYFGWLIHCKHWIIFTFTDHEYNQINQKNVASFVLSLIKFSIL